MTELSSTIIPAANPLEEALNSLDLNGCLMLSNLLLQKAIYLKQQEDAKGKPKILSPNTPSSLILQKD